MATMTASAATFTSAVGVFPTTVITPAMVRALDSVDDNGRIRCTTQTFKRLARYGLAETRGLCDYITHAGWNAAALFLLPNEHKIQYSHESVQSPHPGSFNMRGEQVYSVSFVYSAWCSCRNFRYHGDENGRRYAVKQHKNAIGVTA